MSLQSQSGAEVLQNSWKAAGLQSMLNPKEVVLNTSHQQLDR